MKKLDNIKRIEITDEAVFIEGKPIKPGINFMDWLLENVRMEYTAKNFIENNPVCLNYRFNDVKGLEFYVENSIVEKIHIYPFLPSNNGFCFDGEIIAFGKVLPKPFLSDEIEIYFPEFKIEKPPGGYFPRFFAMNTVVNNMKSFKVEIMMSRSPQYVASISFGLL